MEYIIELTEECTSWILSLNPAEQEDVAVVLKLLKEKGTHLGFPYSSKIMDSDYSHMRELRIQHKGDPYRILYAFDPRRVAVLLIGGSKTGKDRWYKKMIPVADKLYRQHIEKLED
jgi:hypothetical protein